MKITPNQFLETIQFGLPGCVVEDLDTGEMCAEVNWKGQLFCVSVASVDGWPVFLVTQGQFELNERTAKVLGHLDSVLSEVLNFKFDYRTLVRRLAERRLREQFEEGGDDDTVDSI